jgi:hypothetical protein
VVVKKSSEQGALLGPGGFGDIYLMNVKSDGQHYSEQPLVIPAHLALLNAQGPRRNMYGLCTQARENGT